MPRRIRATRAPWPGPDPFKGTEPGELGRYRSYFFPARLYWPADAENDILVPRGLLLAVVNGGLPESDMTTAQNYYVPYHPGALYGTGSDTCVGILREPIDATYTDHVIAAVNRGDAIEAYCHVCGVYNNLPAAAKTNLTLVKWV